MQVVNGKEEDILLSYLTVLLVEKLQDGLTFAYSSHPCQNEYSPTLLVEKTVLDAVQNLRIPLKLRIGLSGNDPWLLNYRLGLATVPPGWARMS